MDSFNQYLLLFKLSRREKMTNFYTVLLYVFVSMSFKCSLFLFILSVFVTEISHYFSGWYLEHYRKELHGRSGLKRCLLPFLLLGYG